MDLGSSSLANRYWWYWRYYIPGEEALRPSDP
jgi:hypothetical protein